MGGLTQHTPKSTGTPTCVLAAMDVSRSLPWFAISVRDIRMPRIEEFNDLQPAPPFSRPPQRATCSDESSVRRPPSAVGVAQVPVAAHCDVAVRSLVCPVGRLTGRASQLAIGCAVTQSNSEVGNSRREAPSCDRACRLASVRPSCPAPCLSRSLLRTVREVVSMAVAS